jgi:hypothetical protein
VTKVLLTAKGWRIAAAIWLSVGSLTVASADNLPQKPAEALYMQLGQVGLDPARVYKVRGASIERSAIHISLEDGTIGFTQDVMGRITGAFFEGDGLFLADVLAEQVNLAIPMKIICRSDCRGLCPHCGANLNNEECRCEKHGSDPRLAPLARLKQDWFKKQ